MKELEPGEVKESIFLELFGANPLHRILDFFVVWDNFDYPMSDIARNAGVGYSTLKLLWPNLVKAGMVEQTRQVGKAKLFALNNESEIVKRFKTFYWAVTRAETEKLLEKEFGKGYGQKCEQKVKAVVRAAKQTKN